MNKISVSIPDSNIIKGATFTPSVSDDGILSWTNDGFLENPEPVDIKGWVGNTLYTTFSIDPITGMLTAHIPDGYSGPKFKINNKGELVVSIENESYEY